MSIYSVAQDARSSYADAKTALNSHVEPTPTPHSDMHIGPLVAIFVLVAVVCYKLGSRNKEGELMKKATLELLRKNNITLLEAPSSIHSAAPAPTALPTEPAEPKEPAAAPSLMSATLQPIPPEEEPLPQHIADYTSSVQTAEVSPEVPVPRNRARRVMTEDSDVPVDPGPTQAEMDWEMAQQLSLDELFADPAVRQTT